MRRAACRTRRSRRISLLLLAFLCGLAAPHRCAGSGSGSSTGAGRRRLARAQAPAAPSAPLPLISQNVTSSADLAVSIGRNPAGIVTVGLFGGVAPNAVAKFSTICRGDFLAGCSYRNSTFHRVEAGVLLQGGDCQSPARDGSGGWGVYSKTPRDPNTTIDMDRGALMWATPATTTAGSQFVLLAGRTDRLQQGARQVFGRVLSGLDLVDRLAALDADGDGEPDQPIVISTCSLRNTTFVPPRPRVPPGEDIRGPPSPNEGAPDGVTATIDLEVSVGTARAGVISVGVFARAARNAVAKFAHMCRGASKPCMLTNSMVTRADPDFMVQVGDCLNDGSGSWGVFADAAPDEGNATQMPVEAGSVAWAAPASWTRGSQFFIAFAPARWLNGKHVVFGRVLSGMDLVRTVANPSKLDADGRPLKPVRISGCSITGPTPLLKTLNASSMAQLLSTGPSVNLSAPAPPVAGDPTKVTERVLLDIEAGGAPAGTVTVGLYGNAVPGTVGELVATCRGNGSGVTLDPGSDAPTGADANLPLSKGSLVLATPGVQASDLRFEVMSADAPRPQGQQRVLGRVLAGMDLIDSLSSAEAGNKSRGALVPLAATACRTLLDAAASAALASADAAASVALLAPPPLPAPEEQQNDTTITAVAELGISNGTQLAGVISLGLYGTASPVAVADFITTCNGNPTNVTFIGMPLFRVDNSTIKVGGECASCDSTSGKDGTVDTNPKLQVLRGALAVASSSAADANARRFSISTARANWLDGKRAVFGRVLSGMDLVDDVFSMQQDKNKQPLTPATISFCQATPVSEPEA